ncbi:MAG: nucleotide-binding protein [Nitrospira sp.]
MSVKRRVYISAPRDIRLDPLRRKIKQAIVDEIKGTGYEPQIFLAPEGGVGLAAGAGWSLEEVEKVARGCAGAAIIGLPFWKTTLEGREVWLPTDYCPYEAAVAHTLDLPILAISIEIEQRGIFDQHARVHAITIPLKEDLSWLQTESFRGPFATWKRAIEERRDIFLGYCSSSTDTANTLKGFLISEVGLSVLDWATDFDPATSILQQIEMASKRCGAGIFLFTKDDELADGSAKVQAVPRDNVVFEAGYFSALKGKSRVLIVRESGAKMPADLGGDIYAQLEDRQQIEPIKSVISRFLNSL